MQKQKLIQKIFTVLKKDKLHIFLPEWFYESYLEEIEKEGKLQESEMGNFEERIERVNQAHSNVSYSGVLNIQKPDSGKLLLMFVQSCSSKNDLVEKVGRL